MNNSDTMMAYLDMLLKESNFHKAAEKLYISQPYLSKLIKQLENKLGTKVLNHDTVPFSLTDAGLVYYHYLENISSQNHHLTQQLQRFIDNDKEIIRIAVLESLGTFLLPKILPQFLKEHPNVKIQIAEGFPNMSEERLLNNHVDCYMGQTPETLSQGIKAHVNGGEVYYIVIPEESKYFIKNKFILSPDSYNLEDLLQEPFILSSPDSAIRHQVNGLFQTYKIVPKISMITNSVITAANLSINGLGLTFSCASVLKRIQEKPINLYPLDPNLIKVRYFIGTKKGSQLSPALQDLVTTFEKVPLQENIR
ncbi:DNA-binding transcriptional LysR family regulator [Lactobacillus colini]|uniref:DNA-binding transcriptional LysR family regulator n=1 Tax=Lactobacillus colini TaxID=1819254 RepID=A0ABS4MHF2_9LACO|nr:LysR family transcriptional regulator [Lactobacillus colini]MBP2058771.1 DNA-binding transcriptional LysR family regulator [Lactobacillus colini]